MQQHNFVLWQALERGQECGCVRALQAAMYSSAPL